jgi:hypothetical protein
VIVQVEIPGHLAPALKSAVELVSSHVGQKLEGPQESRKVQAFTDAAIALGILRAACNKAIVNSNPHIA